MKPTIRFGLAGLVVAATGITAAWGASHREAPSIAMDATADNTDVYAFVSYDKKSARGGPDRRRVTLIMNVAPGQEPGDGPNYFEFSDDVLYRLHVDNNADGEAEDIVYEFRFNTETRPVGGALTGPVPLIGNPNIPIDALTGVVTLDGPGSEGLTRRQTFTVTEVRDGVSTELFQDQTLVAVPSNSGPATFPDYEDLASQGIYSENGVRVFAGQRAETFYIDLGAVFDTVNLRRFPPVLTEDEDFDDPEEPENPFGVNRFSGFNVNTIAIELPVSHLTVDGENGEDTTNPVIGVYSSTSRQATRVLEADGTTTHSGPWMQVSRMGNALVNELLIDTPTKDFWNTQEPEDEAQFEAFFQNPTVAQELFLIFNLPVTPTPRTDLMQAFLKYPGQSVADDGSCGNPCAELLRLDLSVPPTRADEQDRLGSVIGTDPAGFPNGRRPNDDVTDIAIRVVGGANYIANRIGDGVNALEDAPGIGTSDGPRYGKRPGNRLDVSERGIAMEFPFLPTPHDGRDRQHIDCDEDDANDCDEGFGDNDDDDD